MKRIESSFAMPSIASQGLGARSLGLGLEVEGEDGHDPQQPGVLPCLSASCMFQPQTVKMMSNF